MQTWLPAFSGIFQHFKKCKGLWGWFLGKKYVTENHNKQICFQAVTIRLICDKKYCILSWTYRAFCSKVNYKLQCHARGHHSWGCFFFLLFVFRGTQCCVTSNPLFQPPNKHDFLFHSCSCFVLLCLEARTYITS